MNSNRISISEKNPALLDRMSTKTHEGLSVKALASVLENLLIQEGKQNSPNEDPPLMQDQQAMLANGDLIYGPVEGSLFVDGVAPNDIRQGNIGDCYFVAALAAVADSNPGFIAESIKLNADGTYTVRFFKNGKPVFVTVDNDLVHSAKSKNLIYASSTNKKELWVAIMEKAYAKWKTGYEKIGRGGNTSKALAEITGIKNGVIGNKSISSEQLFSKLNKALKNNIAVTADTYGKSKKYGENGLVSAHAYTVLDTQIKDGKKYVVLRNPWGFKEWKGLGADKTNNGTFSMPIEKFKQLFESVSIADKRPISSVIKTRMLI